MTRERRSFSAEVKLQMFRLQKNGKPRNEIIREYDFTPSTFVNGGYKMQENG